MPKIVDTKPYNGVEERIKRLGLSALFDEVCSIITGFSLLVKEAKDANGGAAVRKLIDEQFKRAVGWANKQTGDVDWTKCQVLNGTKVCLGVEIQFSARSDLLVIDLIHLRKAIVSGVIDVGVLVVPSNKLAVFLTDRGPKMADAMRHVVEARVEDLPLILIALDHDGPGTALAKQKKKAMEIEELPRVADDEEPYDEEGPTNRAK